MSMMDVDCEIHGDSGGFKMFQWLIHVFPVDVICESSTQMVGSSDPAHLTHRAHWTPYIKRLQSGWHGGVQSGS